MKSSLLKYFNQTTWQIDVQELYKAHANCSTQIYYSKLYFQTLEDNKQVRLVLMRKKLKGGK